MNYSQVDTLQRRANDFKPCLSCNRGLSRSKQVRKPSMCSLYCTVWLKELWLFQGRKDPVIVELYPVVSRLDCCNILYVGLHLTVLAKDHIMTALFYLCWPSITIWFNSRWRYWPFMTYMKVHATHLWRPVHLDRRQTEKGPSWSQHQIFFPMISLSPSLLLFFSSGWRFLLSLVYP